MSGAASALPPAVILAGGRSSRMGGGDKTLMALNGQPLLRHVLDRLSPQARPIAISANGDPSRFAGFGLPVLPDSVPDFPGPLAGILAAMDWAAGLGASRVVSVSGDTPFLPGDLIARLERAAGAAGLALAADQEPGADPRLHPTIALWPVALREDLRGALARGQRRLWQWAASHGHGTAVFDATGTPFFNINRPEDLSRAGALF
ncbi:MAG: molybdenum cofactor guanylyltransferase MobA [Paracoccus sp. (in: a-proteobacteria)]